MTRRGAITARISKKDKNFPKVDVQVAICLALAEADGVTVDQAHIFIDDGIAASGKQIDDTTLENRPGALACLKAIEAGEIDVLYAVEGERLARTYLDGLRWIQASAKHHVTWHFDTDGIIDPSTPAGEETAVSIFASGRREGRVRQARQERRYNRERAQGLPTWGIRPLGFEGRTPLTQEKAEELGWDWAEGDLYIPVRPSEAAVMREAILNLTSGKESLWGIATRWTKEGVKTDAMGRMRRDRKTGEEKIIPQVWVASTVRQVLIRPRNAGILVHQGTELPNSRIEPIITREEHDNLLAAIKQKGILTPQKPGPKEKYLLSGIIECVCGDRCYATPMYSQRKGGPRHVYAIYRCRTYLTNREVKHSSINAKIADAFVKGAITPILLNGLLDASDDTKVEEDLRDLSRRSQELTERLEHATSIITDHTLKLAHPKARADLASIEVEMDQLNQERNTLLAQQSEGGALAEFMTLLKGMNLELLMLKEDLWTKFYQVFNHLWNEHPFEKRREIIRASIRIRTTVGGRGFERLQFMPLLSGHEQEWKSVTS